MSASELFDLVRPAAVLASALISTLVFWSSRKRYPSYQALLWAIATFFFPLIVLPIYLLVLLLKRTKLHPKLQFILPIVYLPIVLSTAAAYKYFDDRSIDAYLARAINARVRLNPRAAVREYREALKIEDTPHTRKLLAATLEEAGLDSEAIAEYRAAERGGEPDDMINYRLGVLLERANEKDEALIEFKKFASSKTCLHVDNWCEDARQKIAGANK